MSTADTPKPKPEGYIAATVHPSFLNTNAQHHPWVFSAIAELIDNAYDPDVTADLLQIQEEKRNGKPCLVFNDNGQGMDFEHLTKMLSFGFCEKGKYKDTKDSHAPIGQYGNGFKSGSMRLAKDALVFTVHKATETACIGLLSQTLCTERKINALVFPMMEYNMPSLQRSSRTDLDMEEALEAILEVSPYSSEEELKAELSTLRKQKKRSGTKIVLFGLHRSESGTFELDFKSDPEDIRNPNQHADGQESKIFGYKQSLRRYCSILFRDTKMSIEIRGKLVEKFYFLGDLKERKEMTYKPRGKGKTVDITFGREKKTGSGKLEDHGVLFYHRNRLIKPYVKLPCQDKGIGQDVVGIVDVTDVLEPINNKQDFEVKHSEYGHLITALTKKLREYCGVQDDAEKTGTDDPEETKSWVSCNGCGKWRRLPKDFPSDVLPRKWFCYLNPDLLRNRCDIDQEDISQEEDLPGPLSKAKRKSTEPGEQTAAKLPRTSPAPIQKGHEPSTSAHAPLGQAVTDQAAPGHGPPGQSFPTGLKTTPISTGPKLQLKPLQDLRPTTTSSMRPSQSKVPMPTPDTATKLREASLILTDTRGPSDSAAELQSMVPGPAKKTAVLIPVQPQSSNSPFLNPVNNQRSIGSVSSPDLNRGPPSLGLTAAHNSRGTARVPATAGKKKSLDEAFLNKKVSELAKVVAKASFTMDSGSGSRFSTPAPSRPKSPQKTNTQDGKEKSSPEALLPREQKEQGKTFHRNVHQLLKYLVGTQRVGDVDQVEESVQRVLEVLGLPFE